MEGEVERPGRQLAAKTLRADSPLGGGGGVRSSPCAQLARTCWSPHPGNPNPHQPSPSRLGPSPSTRHPSNSNPHPSPSPTPKPKHTREGYALQYTSHKKGGEQRAIPWATVRAVRRGDPAKFELVTSQQ